jgi:pimeloyl-ACP methyl ester carboxylesterase
MDPSVALVRTALNATSLVAPRMAGRAAFELFRHPIRRGRLRAAEREVHHGAQVEQLAVNGKRVTAYRWGDCSRPVLLLHGWQSRTSRYAPLVPQLRALGFSPIGFDAPGHGESAGRATTILEYRELIGQLQDRYGPFEAIVAHSFGVTCAFLALRTGIRAERLVAVAGVTEGRFLVDGFRAQLGLDARTERDLTRRIEQDLFPGLDAIWERFDAAHRPEEVGVPVLVVHDEDDSMVPPAQAHRLKAAYGDQVELLITRGLGHRRILTEPIVLDHVVGFLAADDNANEKVTA